jgi:hypothetical protein
MLLGESVTVKRELEERTGKIAAGVAAGTSNVMQLHDLNVLAS